MAARTPLNHRRPWSADEDVLLFNLVKEDTPVRHIALQLQRTLAAVQHRAQALRIPLVPRSDPRSRHARGPFALSQPLGLTRPHSGRTPRRGRARAGSRGSRRARP